MPLSAGTAYVDIRPVMVRFGRDLNRQLGPAVAGTTSAVNKVGTSLTSKLTNPLRQLGISGPLAFAALGAAAFSFGKSAVSAFQESRQIAEQTEARLKDTGAAAWITADAIEGLAKSVRDYSGISDEAVQAAENWLLTFRNIRNEAGAGNDIFNQATEAVADLATAMNDGAIPSMEQMHSASTLLGKALNDPLKGITALTRAGVTFTDEQKAQIKALVEANDLMGAQKIILGELTKQVGDAAEAAGRANPFTILAEKAGDLKEVIGELIARLLEAILPLLEALMLVLEPALKALAAALKPVIDAFTWLIDNVPGLKIIMGTLATILTISLIPAMVRMVKTIFTSVVPGLGAQALAANTAAAATERLAAAEASAAAGAVGTGGKGGLFGAIARVLPMLGRFALGVGGLATLIAGSIGIAAGAIAGAIFDATNNKPLEPGQAEEIGKEIGEALAGIGQDVGDGIGAAGEEVTDELAAAGEDIDAESGAIPSAIVSAAGAIGEASDMFTDWVDYLREQFGDQVAENALAGQAAVEAAQRREPFSAILPAGVQIPGLDTGGYITESGLAKVHKGETVVPAGGAEPHYHLHVGQFMGTPSEARRAIRELGRMQTEDMRRGLAGSRA